MTKRIAHNLILAAISVLPLLARGELKDVVDNLDSKVRARVYAYPAAPGDSVVPTPLIENALIATEFMYAWKTWAALPGDIRFDTTGWLEYGLPYAYRWTGGFRLFQDDATLSRPVVVNELYLTKQVQAMDLLIGRVIERNTLSVLYPLADRYSARDFNDPLNPKILGAWQARAEYHLRDWQVAVAALPVFQPPKVPGIESRWWLRRIEPITGEPIPPGATGSLERDIPGTSWENTSALASIKTRQQQWDFFTTAYHGYTPYSVTRVASPSPGQYIVTLEYVPGFEWSGGLSTTLDAVELHTEALYHHSYSGDDDDYINGLVGFMWNPDFLTDLLRCNQTHLIIEYSKEFMVKEQDPNSGFVSSSEPFRFGKNTLLAEYLMEISSQDTAAITYIQNFDDMNGYLQLRAGRRFGNGVRLEAGIDILAGSGLYFGTWANNDRIFINYEYNF